ncbi:hypothetical protein MMC25_007208 [Agyrium rufum]|nr:hypothetical protein [Agyrium rufum]
MPSLAGAPSTISRSHTEKRRRSVRRHKEAAPTTLQVEETVIEQPSREEIRRRRADYYGKDPDLRRRDIERQMAREVQRSRTVSAAKSSRHSSAPELERRTRPRDDGRRKRPEIIREEDDDRTEYVYRDAPPPRAREDVSVDEVVYIRRPHKAQSGIEEEPTYTRRRPVRSERIVEVPRDRIKRRPSVTQETERRSGERAFETRNVSRASLALRERNGDILLRSAPARDRAATVGQPLQRSRTAASSRDRAPSIMHTTAPSVVTQDVSRKSVYGTTTRKGDRSSGIFSKFFGPPAPVEPEPRVECLICFSDLPRSRTAKLACGHRMCNACLKRVFTLSVSDPAHMPPTCCTSDHIPVKHVDKLFDRNFKAQWNKKYSEYTTKNRIYCPSRRCGEWIKPNHIATDPGSGRKYGKCTRCRTKVCATCNGRWHMSRECPTDPATREFVEIAKQKGWQRCFNCGSMVELKEGCNHMTCRCQAEFCMICGLQWKTCDCPWFNAEAVEEDRRLHQGADALPRPRYREEMALRREQEARDEAIARRLQVLTMLDNEQDDGVLEHVERDYGNIWGVGNAAGHYMNEHYVVQVPVPPEPVRVPEMGARGQRQQARSPPPAPPLLRSNTTTFRARASERLVPRRQPTNDYAAEAARHRPTTARPAPRPTASVVGGSVFGGSRRAVRVRQVRASTPRKDSSSAVKAGLREDISTPDGRVEEWARHIEDVDGDAAGAEEVAA